MQGSGLAHKISNERLDQDSIIKMPSLHLASTSRPAVLFPVPDDGKIHPISLDLGFAEKHCLHVQLGDHTPQASSSAVPAASNATATAGQKRRRRSSRLPASHSGSLEQLCLTVRYTPPTTQQDMKATRSVQLYHARTIRQIETAFRNAKQARLELEAAPATTKTDLVAAALEIHLLTKELNRRRAIEVLYFEQTTTSKWFVVQAGIPSRLLGVPGSPVVCLYGGDGIVDVTSMDEVVTARRSVPVAPVFGEAEITWLDENMETAPREVQESKVQQYRASAMAGDAYGESNLGYCYYHGYGVTEDDQQAVAWYRKAAKQGHARGQYNLGVCYKKGYGVTRDDQQAVAWYRKAAEQGDAPGQNNLGYCYQHGHGVTQDYQQAVAWYRKAAEQGDASAQYNLGYCYDEGLGVTQDDQQAVAWFRKAAEQGHVFAQYNLGMCYEEGLVVTQDYQQAVAWYRKAAEQGDADAQDNLSLLFADHPDLF